MPSSLHRVLRNVAVAGEASLDAEPAPRLVGEAPADAYARGFTDGLAAGRREGAAIGEEAAAGVTAALDGVRAHLAELRLTQAEAVVATAIEVAETILGREPGLDTDVLVDRLGRALRALDDEPLTILLNPLDREAFGDDLAVRFALGVEADPSLGRGEARVRGAWSRADLTRRAALDAVKEVLS